MTMLHPERLWWLAAVLPAVALLVISSQRSRAIRRRLAGAIDDERRDRLRVMLSGVSLLLAVVAAVIASTAPQWGVVPGDGVDSGLDLVVAVDVSRSMLVRDVRPSRLERAVDLVGDLHDRLGAPAAALIAFRGRPATVVPLSRDSVAFTRAIRSLGPSLVATPGTDIAAAVDAALATFVASSPARRVLLIVSDGAIQSGSVNQAITRLREESVRVVGVSIGTDDGATIPFAGGVLRDARGRPIVARRELDALESLAERTGGFVVDAAAPDALAQLRSGIGAYTSGATTRPSGRAGLIALIAWLLLTLHLVFDRLPTGVTR